jgi:hypothetical protein
MNFFFQGSWGLGAHKNFEVVIPFGEEGLAHYWRDNGVPGAPWDGPVTFGAGKVVGATVIEGSWGPGNFEVVAVRDHRLEHYYRAGSPPQWHGPFGIPLPHGKTVSGGPALVQGGSGPEDHRNLELVVPGAQGLLCHVWRDSETMEWRNTTTFGTERLAYGASMISAHDRNPEREGLGALFVVSCDDQLFLHSRSWDNSPWGLWSVPVLIPNSRGVRGTPGATQTDYADVRIEIVAPLAKGRLAHFFQDGSQWGRFEFGTDLYSAAALIQSDFYGGEREGEWHGNLEVVAIPVGRRGFDHYWRDSGTWEWHGPVVVA